MILNLEIGIKNTHCRVVREEDMASFFGTEHMPVLSTSRIVAFMEYVALSSVQSSLPEGYSTLGTEICIKHKKPVTINKNITCTSRLTDIIGRRLYFEISISTNEEEVAQATHTRAVINKSVFERLIERNDYKKS